MADVVLDAVGKSYGNTVAVHEFQLAVRDGEFLVLLGPSGCGKSTTLRMIAGLESISEGTLSIGGNRMNDVDPKDRGVAMVFQNYALYPHKSVFDNMAMALKLQKVSANEIERRVHETAELLGLTPYLQRRPAALSGGQRQRVAIGRAIVRTPEVFLFDEPLSNLDAKLRVRTRMELKELHDKIGVTSIYVTHDQIEAMTLADRIVIMNEGRIAQVGSPRDVYDQPADEFVAGFIGSPAMNFIDMQRNDADQLQAGTLFLPGPDAVGVAQLSRYRVGIRPEHLIIKNEGGSSDNDHSSTFKAQVRLAELLGADALLNLDIGDTTLLARVAGSDHPVRGDTVSVTIPSNRLHLFDPETGQALKQAAPHEAV